MTRFHARRRRGFTLIEVLVALALLLAGIVTIVQLFPTSLKANADAALKGSSAVLTQQKVEELRRDADWAGDIIVEVQNLSAPTLPVAWPLDTRLTYSYNGESFFSDTDTPTDPTDDADTARVAVRLNPEFDPRGTIVHEMRFDR